MILPFLATFFAIACRVFVFVFVQRNGPEKEKSVRYGGNWNRQRDQRGVLSVGQVDRRQSHRIGACRRLLFQHVIVDLLISSRKKQEREANE